MKRVVLNDFNLNDDDIEFDVIRVKALIINSKGEILLAHNNNTYQFLGGHREGKEALEDTLTREIKEEMGIDVEIDDGPFMHIMTYDNNYFNTARKVCNKIYYFIVHNDKLPNIYETNYDELERQSDFHLVYVKLSKLKKFLQNAMMDEDLDKNIGREMLLVLEEYDRLYGGIE